MKTRLIISAVVLVLVAGCAAFDDSAGQPYEGFGPDVTPPPVGGGKYDGIYKGDMVLTKNECKEMTDAVETKTPITLDVLQSGKVVSVAFEDKTEATGNLSDTKVSVIKNDKSSSRVFYLEFSDTGVKGTCEYIEGVADKGELGKPCADYSFELAKEKK